VRTLTRGEVVVHVGDPGRYVFFIKSGLLTVQCFVDDTGQPIPLKILRPDLVAPVPGEQFETIPRMSKHFQWHENDLKKPFTKAKDIAFIGPGDVYNDAQVMPGSSKLSKERIHLSQLVVTSDIVLLYQISREQFERIVGKNRVKGHPAALVASRKSLRLHHLRKISCTARKTENSVEKQSAVAMEPTEVDEWPVYRRLPRNKNLPAFDSANFAAELDAYTLPNWRNPSENIVPASAFTAASMPTCDSPLVWGLKAAYDEEVASQLARTPGSVRPAPKPRARPSLVLSQLRDSIKVQLATDLQPSPIGSDYNRNSNERPATALSAASQAKRNTRTCSKSSDARPVSAASSSLVDTLRSERGSRYRLKNEYTFVDVKKSINGSQTLPSQSPQPFRERKSRSSHLLKVNMSDFGLEDLSLEVPEMRYTISGSVKPNQRDIARRRQHTRGLPKPPVGL